MNENHIRILGVYLNNIEKNLDNIRRELHFDPARIQPVLYSVMDDVGEDARDTLLLNTSFMSRELGLIKNEFGLMTQHESSRRRIDGALSEIWATIYDLRPQRLESYGSLTGDDEERLDSVVSRLQRLLTEMYSALELPV